MANQELPAKLQANVDIIRAFGLDPRFVRSFSIVLDKDRGPIATAEMYEVNNHGHRINNEDGSPATVLKRYTFTEEIEA